MKSRLARYLSISILILLLIGCVPTPPPSIIDTPTPISTLTETPTQTVTATFEPTEISTPTLTPCDFCPVLTDPNEITICSKNSSGPAGVRVIARWLAQPGKKGFYVAAQDSMNVSSIRFSGWDPRIDGQQITFESTEDSGKCGYPATWNSWWDPDSSNPAVGSNVTVEFVDSNGRVVVTVNLTVAESELILDSFEDQR